MEKKSSFPIKKNDIDGLRADAKGYMQSVSYIPTVVGVQNDKSQDATITDTLALLSKIKSGTSNSVNIIEAVGKLRAKLLPAGVLPPAKISKFILDLQDAIAIGLWMKKSYSDSSNLSVFQQKLQTQTRLTSTDQAEYEAKQQTATAVMLYTVAIYMLKCLTPIRTDDTTMTNKYAGIPEINLTIPVKGLSSVLFYFQRYLDSDDFISSEQDAVNFALMYFEEVRLYMVQRKESFKYTEAFTDKTYLLEDSDFSIDGWETEVSAKVTSVEFNKTKFEDIVGNREAKHLARRIVAAILSYCFKTKRNPYDAIAKYARVIMGYGFPGTGKSLLIAAVATELAERCKWLGIPFLFHPFPDNIVSTYQGGSAERAIEWFKPQADPTRIIYAPIDDAENNLMDRSKDGVSAGVKEVIGVFLRMTEGAYATNFGNSLIGLYTNRPEDIDKAVLSRIQKRAPIAGAVTHNDFFDQNHLWLKKHTENLGELVKLDEVTDYKPMSDQAQLTSLSELIQEPDQIITHPVLRKVYDNVLKKYNKSNPHFYAALMYQMQQECKLFTSREARNIQTNIDTRMADFDLPEIFWEKEEEYFLKTYEQKSDILKTLMKESLQGKSVADMMLQEALKYMDTFISINLSEEDRKIQQYVDQLIIRTKAEERFKKLNEKVA